MIPSDDFGFIPLEASSSNSEDDFGFIPLHEYEEKPSVESEIKRHSIRSASRAAETALGLPGDILKTLQIGLGKGIGKLTGNKLIEEAIIEGPGSIRGDEFIPENVPTSSELKQGSQDISQGYTAPQSSIEEFADEVISDLTALATPIGKAPSFLKALGISLGANLAKEGAKSLGAEEKGQAGTKIASMFLLGLIGGRNANGFVKNLYEDAKSKLPKNTMLPSENLLKDLGKVESEISKGISTPTKEQVTKAIKDLEKKAAGGALPAEDLVQSYHDVHEIMSSKKLFDELTKSERKILKTRFDKFKGAVSKSIDEYGKYNPEFYNSWKSANEAFGAIQQSKKVSNMLGRAIKSKPSLYASPALAAFHFLHPSALLNPATIATGTASFGALKGSELLYRVVKSPTLRRHYMNVVEESIKDNTKGVVRNLQALDNDLKKDLSLDFVPSED